MQIHQFTNSPIYQLVNSPVKRLLTIGHSYVVAQNRRLAHEMARAGSGEWQVTAAAPARLRGDLRDIELEPIPDEACAVVPLDVRFGPHAHLRMYGRQLRSLLRQPWDVIHCWEEPYVIAAAQIARLVQRPARFVPATFQNIGKAYPLPVRVLERRVMARADAWIAFGRTAYVVQRDRPGYASKPATTLSPGVDIETFRPDPSQRHRTRERLDWGSNEIVVGFVGRFVEEKGIDTLLQAFARAAGGWSLLFVGGGALASRIESVQHQHPARVRLVKDASHDDVPRYLNAMDVLCAPSRTTVRWKEQFGRMLIEAMACGVAVIASDSGEIPHVVQDAGLIIGEGDAARWAATIDRVAADGTLRDDLATRGMVRARAEFAWPIVARRHLDFFEEVLSR
jgi:glycosyltransferase involved in cell wall biosynthesis